MYRELEMSKICESLLIWHLTRMFPSVTNIFFRTATFNKGKATRSSSEFTIMKIYMIEFI